MVCSIRIHDIEDWVKNFNESKRKKCGQSSEIEENIYREFCLLLRYYSFRHVCKSSIEELKQLFETNLVVTKEMVSGWANKYENLGANDLLMFQVDFLNGSSNNLHNLPYLPYAKAFIEENDFRDLISFNNVFQILFWECEKTSADSSNLKAGYYDTPSRDQTLADTIAQIKKLLYIFPTD